MSPSCPKCGNSTFSLEELKVKKSNFQVLGVCCSSCGSVVGIQEPLNISSLIMKLAKGLNISI
jgi:uncharacterized Zn finger protein